MTKSTLLENQWNPVQLGKKDQGGYKVSSYQMSSQWYNEQMHNTGDRLLRLQRYHDMDLTSVEIGRALDIISEDVSSCNADEQDPLYVHYPEDAKILKSTMRVLEDVLDIWEHRTLMEEKLFDRVRKTLKFGATFFRKNSDGTLKELRPERMVGYILDHDDEERVTHYIYDEEIPSLHDRLSPTKRRNIGQTQKKEKEIIPVSDLVIFKIGDGPFGESILERVFTTWRQMTLLEDAVVIYRIVRAPERRIYYIDVGNLQGPKRERAIENQRLRLAQKQASKNGQLTSEYDPHSIGEDIFIPTNSTGKGSRVETLQGGQNMGEMSDVEWFHKKLAAGLRVPNSMVDIQGDQRDQHSDARVGQLYQVEMRYMGHVRRVAKMFARILTENYTEFARRRDLIVPEGVEIRINPPMSFAAYKDIELNQTLLNTYSASMQINSMSRRYAMQKFLQMDPDDLANNEVDKLKELGLTEEVIKAMPDEHVANLVYGDAHVATEYGLAEPEPGFGGGRF